MPVKLAPGPLLFTHRESLWLLVPLRDAWSPQLRSVELCDKIMELPPEKDGACLSRKTVSGRSNAEETQPPPAIPVTPPSLARNTPGNGSQPQIQPPRCPLLTFQQLSKCPCSESGNSPPRSPLPPNAGEGFFMPARHTSDCKTLFPKRISMSCSFIKTKTASILFQTLAVVLKWWRRRESNPCPEGR